MTEEKKYYNIEELLPIGKYPLKVYPQGIWDDTKKEYTQNTLQTGSYKNGGTWFKYSAVFTKEMTKVSAIFKEGKDKAYIGCFANDKNHEAFKSGYVKAEVKPRKDDKGNVNYDENGNPKLTTMFWSLSENELELFKAESEGNAVSTSSEITTGKEVKPVVEKEISIDDIKF
jgi:hypothetical protein